MIVLKAQQRVKLNKIIRESVGGLGGGDLPDTFFRCFGCVECFRWFVLFCCLAYLCCLPRVFPFSLSESHVAHLEKILAC